MITKSTKVRKKFLLWSMGIIFALFFGYIGATYIIADRAFGSIDAETERVGN